MRERERRQQKRAAAHLIGLRDASFEKRNQPAWIRQHEIAKCAMRFGRRSGIAAEAAVEPRQLVAGRFRKQEVNGGKEHVGNRRPANVACDGQQVVVARNLPGQRGIERPGVRLRFCRELREALRELLEPGVRGPLRRIARGSVPALCALPPHDCGRSARRDATQSAARRHRSLLRRHG